jgi:LPS sulfotransferase NodH
MINLKKKKSIPLKKSDKKVLILSTPRSGSTFFCDVLNNSGEIGECAEWFNMRYMAAYAKMNKSTNLDFQEYYNFISEKTIGDTGIFAVNMHIEQYITMLNNKFDVLSLNFDLVVYLYRKDKLSQAVSLSIAQITDQWSSSTLAAQDIKGKLNVNHITKALTHLVESEKIYAENLKKSTSMECCYEEFTDLNNTIHFSTLFEHLKINPTNFIAKNNSKKQSNNYSQEIRNKYLKYLTGDYKNSFELNY